MSTRHFSFVTDGRAQKHSIIVDPPVAGTQGRFLILQTGLRDGQEPDEVMDPMGKSLLALSTKISFKRDGRVVFAVSHGVGTFHTSRHGDIVQARLLITPGEEPFFGTLVENGRLLLPFPFNSHVTALWEHARTREVRVVNIRGAMQPKLMRDLFEKDGHTVISSAWEVHAKYGFSRSDAMLVSVQSDKPLPASLKMRDGTDEMPCHILEKTGPVGAPDFRARRADMRAAERGPRRIEGGAPVGSPPRITWAGIAAGAPARVVAPTPPAPARLAAREPTGSATPLAPAPAEPAAMETEREEGEITPTPAEQAAAVVDPTEGEESPEPQLGDPEGAAEQDAAEVAVATGPEAGEPKPAELEATDMEATELEVAEREPGRRAGESRAGSRRAGGR